MGFHKLLNEFLVRSLGEHSFLPEVGDQEAVGLGGGIGSALAKLPRMAVHPLADVEESLIPAISSGCLGTGAETMPVSLGVGMGHTATSHSHLSVCQFRSPSSLSSQGQCRA